MDNILLTLNQERIKETLIMIPLLVMELLISM